MKAACACHVGKAELSRAHCFIDTDGLLTSLKG
jgi:hypothetical protein